MHSELVSSQGPLLHGSPSVLVLVGDVIVGVVDWVLSVVVLDAVVTVLAEVVVVDGVVSLIVLVDDVVLDVVISTKQTLQSVDVSF